jgi:hypothetical protein
MNKSDQINELAAALSKAQGTIKGAMKDTANPFFKSKYADLSSVWDACREQLFNNGLSVAQMPFQSESGIGMETVLMHSSGQWISGQFVMPVSKADAQGVGSATTYARRYSLAAMVGVAPEDDDGNAASGKGEKGGKINHQTGEIKPSRITPNDGALDDLPPNERNDAVLIASEIKGFWNENRKEEACKVFYDSDLSNEMKRAVWEVLKPNSEIRNGMKKLHEVAA